MNKSILKYLSLSIVTLTFQNTTKASDWREDDSKSNLIIQQVSRSEVSYQAQQKGIPLQEAFSFWEQSRQKAAVQHLKKLEARKTQLEEQVANFQSRLDELYIEKAEAERRGENAAKLREIITELVVAQRVLDRFDEKILEAFDASVSALMKEFPSAQDAASLIEAFHGIALERGMTNRISSDQQTYIEKSFRRISEYLEQDPILTALKAYVDATKTANEMPEENPKEKIAKNKAITAAKTNFSEAMIDIDESLYELTPEQAVTKIKELTADLLEKRTKAQKRGEKHILMGSQLLPIKTLIQKIESLEFEKTWSNQKIEYLEPIVQTQGSLIQTQGSMIQSQGSLIQALQEQFEAQQRSQEAQSAQIMNVLQENARLLAENNSLLKKNGEFQQTVKDISQNNRDLVEILTEIQDNIYKK
jgi:hypothetical protein